MSLVGARLEDLETPCLVADRARVVANAARMRARMASHDVRLRPHVKTTKSVDIARLAHGGDLGPITVSTLREAEYFAGHGFTDIVYAVALVPNKFARVAALTDRGVDLHVLLADVSVARRLAEFAASRLRPIRVLIEVDSGEHRTGFLPKAASLQETGHVVTGCAGLRLAGLLTHGGHSYQGRCAADLARAADDERRSLLAARDALADVGVSGLTLSSGSTPTAVFGENFDGIDEIRPGVYLAGDLFQAQLGTVAMDDLAVSVLASVLSHDPERNRLTIDAGGLALSKDRSTANSPVDQGYGVVVRADGTHFASDPLVVGVHQEHGEVTAATPLPFAELPVGSAVRVLPNHVCMTAAPYDRYFVVEGGNTTVLAEWEKVTGW